MGIVLDGRRIKAYEAFCELQEYTGRDASWMNELWEKFLLHDELLDEFMYYLDNHTFKDKLSCQGYKMTDLFIFQMSRYNLIRDVGKNTAACNKESMVLGAFYDFACMLENPDEYVKKLSQGPGMDRL